MNYQLLEISLADVNRLYHYYLKGIFNADLNLKGFDYPWLLTSHEWQPEEKVLDVGPGYSPLPAFIEKTYGCETWAADDFGMTVDEEFWERNLSPAQFVKQNSGVKFVLERLGDPGTSSLPRGYFDVIYSLSVLEHVPYTLTPAIWHHMDMLLKPGGEMLHAVELTYPSNGGVKKLLLGLLFDWFHRFIPIGFIQRHGQATPLTYARLVGKILGFKIPSTRNLDVITMCFNPEIMAESYQYGINRIVKDHVQDFHYHRFGTLLIHLRKQS